MDTQSRWFERKAHVVLWFALGVMHLSIQGTALARQDINPPVSGGASDARSCAKERPKDIVNRKVMHGPASSVCGTCHVQVGESRDDKFEFIVAKEQLCLRCHLLLHVRPDQRRCRSGPVRAVAPKVDQTGEFK